MKLNITNLSNKNPFPSAENTCFGHNIISIECFDSLLVEIQNKTSGDMVNYFTNEWVERYTFKGKSICNWAGPKFQFLLSIITTS